MLLLLVISFLSLFIVVEFCYFRYVDTPHLPAVKEADLRTTANYIDIRISYLLHRARIFAMLTSFIPNAMSFDFERRV